jgi:hypothetical protein
LARAFPDLRAAATSAKNQFFGARCGFGGSSLLVRLAILPMFISLPAFCFQ